MSNTAETMIELLRELVAEVAGLRCAMERPRQLQDDRAAVLEMLTAINSAVADRAFTARDILAHAALPQSWRLQTAIGAVVGAGSPARTLGRALRRIDGLALGGLSVQRIGENRDGAIWLVRVLGE